MSTPVGVLLIIFGTIALAGLIAAIWWLAGNRVYRRERAEAIAGAEWIHRTHPSEDRVVVYIERVARWRHHEERVGDRIVIREMNKAFGEWDDEVHAAILEARRRAYAMNRELLG